MDPANPSADANLMNQILAQASPEERAEFLKSIEELRKLPGLLDKMRKEAVSNAVFYQKVFFFGAVFIVVSVFDIGLSFKCGIRTLVICESATVRTHIMVTARFLTHGDTLAPFVSPLFGQYFYYG